MFPYSANLLAGTVGGMMVGDMLGAVPTAAAVPAGGGAKPKVTSDGTPVQTNMSSRQHLSTSALIVIVAGLVLIFGSRVLRDARIG